MTQTTTTANLVTAADHARGLPMLRNNLIALVTKDGQPGWLYAAEPPLGEPWRAHWLPVDDAPETVASGDTLDSLLAAIAEAGYSIVGSTLERCVAEIDPQAQPLTEEWYRAVHKDAIRSRDQASHFADVDLSGHEAWIAAVEQHAASRGISL